jgi:CMP-N-acetylneuraminic acid synthetase
MLRVKALAIIPARGGSKGVHRKNIRALGGRPLISYAIGTALAAKNIDRLIVSTEDPEIADVAKACGADVPFLRPPELAQDDSKVVDALLHTLDRTDREEGYKPDLVVLLQPTSPFLIGSDIDGAVAKCRQPGVDAVVSVCLPDHSPYWMHRMEEDGRLTDFVGTVYESRRQDLPPVYFRNGAIFMAKTEVLVNAGSFFGDRTYAYVMDQDRSLQIDTERDLRLAEIQATRS